MGRLADKLHRIWAERLRLYVGSLVKTPSGTGRLLRVSAEENLARVRVYWGIGAGHVARHTLGKVRPLGLVTRRSCKGGW